MAKVINHFCAGCNEYSSDHPNDLAWFYFHICKKEK